MDFNNNVFHCNKREFKKYREGLGNEKMSKGLIVVESPTKVKTIQKFLGGEYVIKASVGHIKDLPEGELGVDLQKDFEPKYVTIPGKRKDHSGVEKGQQRGGEHLSRA